MAGRFLKEAAVTLVDSIEPGTDADADVGTGPDRDRRRPRRSLDVEIGGERGRPEQCGDDCNPDGSPWRGNALKYPR